jgi:large conductance mechanosensitive channel
MFKEFKEFAMKGNVVDMAVGIIIGAAFGKIVSSFVGDLIMPVIGRLLGKVDFTKLYINLSGGSYATLDEAKKAGAATINYGIFLNTVLDFLIISFSVFLVIRWMNKLKKTAPVPSPTTKECNFCLSLIPLKATRCPQCTSSL